MSAPPLQPGSSILVFGHHDLDGMVSAAIAGAYLRHLGARPTYATVDFHMKQSWPSMWRDLVRRRSPWARLNDEPLPTGCAIVDFHPTLIPDDRYFFFADHHRNALSGEELSPALARAIGRRMRRGEPIFHDPDCGSCAELLLRELGAFGWRPPATLLAAAELAHASDTAAFPTPSAAVDFRNSDLARADLVAMSLTEEEAARSIAAIEAGAPVLDALIGLHPNSARHILEKANEAVAAYNAVQELLAPNVSVFDFTVGTLPQRVKFAEFSDPRVHYAIQLRPGRLTDDQALVQGLLGRSPWAPPLSPGMRHPDLEVLARVFGDGGGHPFAAGFQVVGRTLAQARAQARAITNLIAAHLHPLPSHHRFADPQSESRAPRRPIHFPTPLRR